ncbi:hypothetical protein C1929_00085 [Stenotrophomonas sp. ZAC14D1_NAIMI4_6]|nr:hypothetical protein C1929_00085 [Stenotrophomonas sp. ZAC14D1_NAIMI4_6]
MGGDVFVVSILLDGSLSRAQSSKLDSTIEAQHQVSGFLQSLIRTLYITQAIQPQARPMPATMISSSPNGDPFNP